MTLIEIFVKYLCVEFLCFTRCDSHIGGTISEAELGAARAAVLAKALTSAISMRADFVARIVG